MTPIFALLALAMAQAAPVDPPDDPKADLADMQQVYDQSCAAREFGAYDDMCDQLRTQIKRARVLADRAAHAPPAPKPPPVPAAPPPLAPTAPTSPPPARAGAPG